MAKSKSKSKGDKGFENKGKIIVKDPHRADGGGTLEVLEIDPKDTKKPPYFQPSAQFTKSPVGANPGSDVHFDWDKTVSGIYFAKNLKVAKSHGRDIIGVLAFNNKGVIIVKDPSVAEGNSLEVTYKDATDPRSSVAAKYVRFTGGSAFKIGQEVKFDFAGTAPDIYATNLK